MREIRKVMSQLLLHGTLRATVFEVDRLPVKGCCVFFCKVHSCCSENYINVFLPASRAEFFYDRLPFAYSSFLLLTYGYKGEEIKQ